MTDTVDIAIVGGGMVGASLAVALDGLGVRVALIEAVPHDAVAQPSFDERTTALSNGSRRILETLGVWPAVSLAATPIAKIHVSDQGRFGFARIDAAEQGLAAMGFVVPNRALGAALWSRLAGSQSVRVFCPARVLRVSADTDAARFALAGEGGETRHPESGVDDAPQGEDVGAAGRVVTEHRIGTERALTTEGQRAEKRRGYAAIVFVVEGLARTRTVDGYRIAGPRKAIVNDVGF